MKPLEAILRNAAQSQKAIALSEGTDPRVVEAAIAARDRGVARIILVGTELGVGQQYKFHKAEHVEGIEVHDPATSHITDELALLYYSLPKHKGLTLDEARGHARQPHIYAALLVKAGYADGCIGGAVLLSADVIKAAIQIIGRAPQANIVSSFFLMLFCSQHHAKKGAYVFGDAGLVVEPTAEELSEIALASARSFLGLTGETPRVAMLSFSTKGSAAHATVSKVQRATDLARKADPYLLIDGELQFDAASVPDVAISKAPGSPTAGKANVFVFPNLETGNIGYKIAQRIGGAVAIGPILQGLAGPANDLSRGCTSEDILHMIAVTATQAQQMDPVTSSMAVQPLTSHL